MPQDPDTVRRRGPGAPALKFTRKELESRNHEENAVVIIDNIVYDVTDLLGEHPGGHTVLLDKAGQDASDCFREVGHSDLAIEWRKEYVIGEVVDAEKWEVKLAPPPLPDSTPGSSLRKIIHSIITPLVAVFIIVYIYKTLFE